MLMLQKQLPLHQLPQTDLTELVAYQMHRIWLLLSVCDREKMCSVPDFSCYHPRQLETTVIAFDFNELISRTIPAS